MIEFLIWKKKLIFLLDFVYGIACNDELKLLATGSNDKSIKLHLFIEKKKEFCEV